MICIAVSSVCKPVVLTGVQLIRLSLPEIIGWYMELRGLLQFKPNRNQIIRMRYTNGATLTDIANDFKLSPQRVFQIIKYRNH